MEFRAIEAGVVRRRTLLGAGIAAATLPRRARAADKPIRIGVLTDMNGVYAANTGPARCSVRRWRSRISWPRIPA
jgi:hypothetical protein